MLVLKSRIHLVLLFCATGSHRPDSYVWRVSAVDPIDVMQAIIYTHTKKLVLG